MVDTQAIQISLIAARVLSTAVSGASAVWVANKAQRKPTKVAVATVVMVEDSATALTEIMVVAAGAATTKATKQDFLLDLGRQSVAFPVTSDYHLYYVSFRFCFLSPPFCISFSY